MSLTANNFGLQEETSTSPNRREIPLLRNSKWGTTERERDIWTERGREMQCFMKKEYKSMIDVEHVDTTGERCAI